MKETDDQEGKEATNDKVTPSFEYIPSEESEEENDEFELKFELIPLGRKKRNYVIKPTKEIIVRYQLSETEKTSPGTYREKYLSLFPIFSVTYKTVLRQLNNQELYVQTTNSRKCWTGYFNH